MSQVLELGHQGQLLLLTGLLQEELGWSHLPALCPVAPEAALLTLLSVEHPQVHAQTRKQYIKPHLPTKGRF